MSRFMFFILVFSLSSCFLFDPFKRSSIRFRDREEFHLVVPRRYVRTELKTDSAGNQVKYYYYGDGSILYFAELKDTSTEFQAIDYSMNLPKELYGSMYFKGVNEKGNYWRESRIGNFKAGYYEVDSDRDGSFDSSVNNFTIHFPRHQ
jgi:hypothetical protein